MKKKAIKRPKRPALEKRKPKVEITAAPPEPQVQPTPSAPLASMPTDPRVLVELAEQEPDQRELSEYIPTIEILRSKNFSYRQIAEWLAGHGVELDHNTIYRLYTKHMSDYDAAVESERADREDEDEAFRNSR